MNLTLDQIEDLKARLAAGERITRLGVILDEIVDRYLLPNGVKFFHLGLDEVWPILGMDEDEPTRVVSPYCKCPECRDKEWYDQFVDYVIALCKHLADKGI